jgi:hypothetical protein
MRLKGRSAAPRNVGCELVGTHTTPMGLTMELMRRELYIAKLFWQGGIWHLFFFSNVAFIGVLDCLELGFYAGLLENCIGSIFGSNRDGNAELLITDRASPYFMAALALPYEIALMSKQHFSQ